MDARDIGETVSDRLFRTNRYGPRAGPGSTSDERESPARVALRAGGVSEDDAINRAAELVIEEIEEDERAQRRGPLSPAARRHL